MLYGLVSMQITQCGWRLGPAKYSTMNVPPRKRFFKIEESFFSLFLVVNDSGINDCMEELPDAKGLTASTLPQYKMSLPHSL